MPGRPPKTDWIVRARRAKALLGGLNAGEREAALVDLAAGADINTVRRSVRALDLLDRWAESKGAFARLEKVPQSILEVFSQWSSFDESGAWNAFRQWEQTKSTVEVLLQKMRAARSDRGLRAAKSIENDYRDLLQPHIRSIISEVLGPKAGIGEPEKNFRSVGEPSVDYRCLIVDKSVSSPPTAVAILIVGPYRSHSMYERRRLNWLEKAFTLAWLYENVILVLPDAREFEGYLSSVKILAGKAQEVMKGRAPGVAVAIAPAAAKIPFDAPSSSE
jgi:hypothetical protein